MSKYLRQYANKQAYTDDTTKPTDHSSVSVAGNGVEFDGKNVIVPYCSAALEVGDEKLYDLAEHREVILKHNTYHAATFESARYVRSEAFYLLSYADKDIFVYKKCIGTKSNSHNGGAADGSEQWAANNEYKVTCDLTEDGGFSYTCTPGSTAISGSCSWSAGDTITSVVSQLTTGSGLTVKVVGEDAIGFSISTNDNGTITFSGVNNATVLDCSFSARIGISGTPKGSHAGFQGQAVKIIFPTLDFMSASPVCYCESGNNSSYRTNIKPDTFKSYHATNGGGAFAAESEVVPMKKSVWDSLAEDEDATHKALYDKYGGDYDEYLLSRRMRKNICKGVNATCREQGMAYTYALANCYFTDAEGNTKHVYPGAAICAAFGIDVSGETTGFEAGNWYLNSCTELVEELTPETAAILNTAIETASNGQAISWRAQWAVGESNARNAWFYYPTYGALSYGNYKSYSYQVRPLLASNRV